jgi:hypothetical protein
VPYELVWIKRPQDLCHFSFNPRPFPCRVGRENAEIILPSSLLPSIDPRRSSKMWIDLLVPTSICVYCHDMWIEAPWNQSPFSSVCARSVFFVVLLIPFLRFPSTAMASGSKEGESLFLFFWLFRAQAPCMLVLY